MENKQIVVNLIGGPGLGKTILAAEIFACLKRLGLTCSIAPEYIKTKLAEQALKEIRCQLKLFAEQHFILFCLQGEVEVIVTDAPLLLFPSYDKTNCPYLKGLVFCEYNKFDNLLYLIERDLNVPYETAGRYQDLDGAKAVDADIKTFLSENNVTYKTVTGIGADSLGTIVQDIKDMLTRDIK